MNNNYVREVIENEALYFNYDSLYNALQLRDSEDFDVFVRVAYIFSQMNLNEQQKERAPKLIQQLALDVFENNIEN